MLAVAIVIAVVVVAGLANLTVPSYCRLLAGNFHFFY